jgi:hypothetical protein
MNGDDKPQFTEDQLKHAVKIKAERAVMDMTGLSRGQLRSMERFQERVTQQQQQRFVRVDDKPRVMQTGEHNFYPKPLVTEKKGGGDDGGGVSMTPNGIINDVIIVFNGTGYYCALNGTVGDAI